MGVSLFIPVYNASRFVEEMSQKAYEALSQLGDDFEIIIVDDGSTDSDQFAEKINKIQYPSNKSIKWVFNDNGPSRRENLAKWFFEAKYDIVCFIDVDLIRGVSYLPQAITLLEKESADVVIGSRYAKGASVQRSRYRVVLSFFYNLTIRLLFGSKIQDHQCGLKVFRKSSGLPVVKSMGYDTSFNRGWFWDAEFLVRAQIANLKIIEMPVSWYDPRASTFNLLREQKCVKAILQLWQKLYFNLNATKPKAELSK